MKPTPTRPMPIKSSEAGSGTVDGGVAENVAEYDELNPPEATCLRMPVTVPPLVPSMSWVVKIPPDPLSPEVLFRKAIPLITNVISTVLGVICSRVNGEPGGVHKAPITFPAQFAAVPIPGAIFVRLKKTVPALTVNDAKSVTEIDPVNGGPVRVFKVPPDNPVNVPVLREGAAGVIVDPKLMAVGVTVTLPLKLAWPVTDVAKEGIANRLPRARASIAPNLIRKINSPPQELWVEGVPPPTIQRYSNLSPLVNDNFL